jgi:hypothetical protein
MPASEPPMPAELLTQFDALSADAKRWLIGRFIAEDAEDDPELLKAEWQAELGRRIEQIRRGEVKLRTADEVWETLQRRLAEVRSKCTSQ